MHQKANTALSEDSLLHWETLLVATSHDLEDVTLELISEVVPNNLLGQPLVIKLAAEDMPDTELSDQVFRVLSNISHNIRSPSY